MGIRFELRIICRLDLSTVFHELESLQRKVLDGSLGFAAGVMLAASFWSLLAPGIEMAQTSGNKITLNRKTESMDYKKQLSVKRWQVFLKTS